ncbi:MAG TPA: type II toxin-antitoxin system VapB family antitoxin [Jiangellaceae bacterium]|nr:type II toxin-antitoxin system VapB family antitoxin [Jiangellaceae bacterium]
MRTTITLDPDVEALVSKVMRERGLTFKEAVNQALRRALSARAERQPYRTPTFDMGEPQLPLERALRLAGDLEDDEIVRKLGLRK